MQNLAYLIDVEPDENVPARAEKSTDDVAVCAACGEQLFGRDAEACSWQAWGTFWEIFGMSNVELVCGACGEYLQGFFNDRK
jgi:ribosomal protein L34E